MSTLKTNTLSNVAGTASTAIENAINGSAKAWVNFNGTGTVAIRASYNVSSITDNNTGDYTVNFTNALTDANYVMHGSQGNNTTADTAAWTVKLQNGSTTMLTTSCRLVTQYSSSGSAALWDPPYVTVSFMR